MIALITGITGQDGSYLTELLLEKNYIVWGIIRRSSTLNTSRIEHLLDKINLRYGDLCDSVSLYNILHEINQLYTFDTLEIYNLGAQSHVKVSFELPIYTCQVDALGTLHLLEAIRTCGFTNKIKLYQASTSELYGKVLEIPQNEKTPFNPRSPYAIAKLYSYWITKNYRESYNMFICNGILFNHESPRRGHNFITKKITLGLAKILTNKEQFLKIGNLDAKRDWGHAKEYVYGMWLMLQQSKPDDYVLATGKNHSVREFIECAFKYKNINIKWKGNGIHEIGYDESTNKELIKIDPKYFRPTEVDELLGNSTKAHLELGWNSKCTFEELVHEMVDYDC